MARPEFLTDTSEVWAACFKPSCYHLYEDCTALHRVPLAWGFDAYTVSEAEARIRSGGFKKEPKCCGTCLQRHAKTTR